MTDDSNYLKLLADILKPHSEENNGVSDIQQPPQIYKIDNIPTHGRECEMRQSKLCPHVEFSYSQDLRVQDVFMPLSFRTPSSASCEWLKVIVKMPEENCPAKEIKADIVDGNLLMDSGKYHLNLNLPQPPTSDPDFHKATWDAEKKQLIVLVKLERELDYVNF